MTTAPTELEIPRGKRGSAPPPETPATTPDQAPDVRMLAIADITTGDNVRGGPGDIDELTASIAQVGVLQPIKVQQAGKAYRVIWGHRRLAASTAAGKTEIPAIIVTDKATADRVALEQLVENIQRQDLNAIDEARGLRKILDARKGLSQQDLALELGRSESWLSNRLRLLGLDATVQEKIAVGELTESHGKAIASLPVAQQREMAKVIAQDGTSVKDVERELEWKRQAAETAEGRANRTAKVGPKIIAALEAADVPKGATVYVQAYGFDKLEPTIKKAGWETTPSHAQPFDQGCKCNAWRVEIDGRSVKVQRACLGDHWRREYDREQNAARQASAAAEKLAKATLETFRAKLTESLLGNPPAETVLHLIAWHMTEGSWPRPTYGAIAALGPGELIGKLVANLTADYKLRSMGDMDVAGLLAELTGTAVGQTSIDDVKGDAIALGIIAAGEQTAADQARAIFADDIAAEAEEPAAPAPEQAAQVEQVEQIAQAEQPLAAGPVTAALEQATAANLGLAAALPAAAPKGGRKAAKT